MNEQMKLVKIRLPEVLVDKINAIIESENYLTKDGSLTTEQWCAWAVEAMEERISKDYNAFYRRTFRCDGCSNLTEYKHLSGLYSVNKERFAYCTACWPVRAKQLGITH